MAESLALLILAAIAMTAPAAVRAETPSQNGQGPQPFGAEEFAGTRLPGQINSVMIRPAVATYYLREPVDRPYPSDYDGALPTESRPRTAVDYRFAPDGLVGSVGYLHANGAYLLDTQALGEARTSRFGGQGSLVGAKLSYAFR